MYARGRTVPGPGRRSAGTTADLRRSGRSLPGIRLQGSGIKYETQEPLTRYLIPDSLIPGPPGGPVLATAHCARRRAPSGDLMSTTNGGPNPEKLPQLNVLTQYIKDFSFENPNAPRSLTPPQPPPAINIQINVKTLTETDYEVDLNIEGKADSAGSVLFGFDLTYAGVFRIQNVAKESMHPLVMIECPRLLFPFAREIVATAVRNGGVPPLLIDPIDFVALYRQKMSELQPQPPPPVA